MIPLTDAYGTERHIDPATVTDIRPYHGDRSVLWIDQGPGQPTLIVITTLSAADAEALFRRGAA
jgi:hypothetical protein